MKASDLFLKSIIDAALTAAKHLKAAAVMANDHTAFRVDWMPFVGLLLLALELFCIQRITVRLPVTGRSTSKPPWHHPFCSSGRRHD
jgi:hypothetical protein